MNILLTCAGRRNYLVNYFKQALSGIGLVYAADMDRSAPALVDADRALVVPSIYDPRYIDTLCELIKENRANAVVSLNDLELPVLAGARTRIEAAGCRLLVSELSVVELVGDKWKSNQFLGCLGLPTPATFKDLSAAKQAITAGQLKFPLVIKPRWGSASIGIEYVETVAELESCYKLVRMRITRSILARLSAQEADQCVLIQEQLQGVEYGIDVVNDLSGHYVGTFARKKLAMRAGETDKAVSVCLDPLTAIGKLLGTTLNHLGNMDCDVFECDGQFYVLEMNPRFGGGYPFSHEAGAHTTDAYVAWLQGQTDVSRFFDYCAGLSFAKYDRLMPV